VSGSIHRLISEAAKAIQDGAREAIARGADVAPADDRLGVNVDPKRQRTIHGKTYLLAKPR
jgi:hypothetical protein